MKSTANQQSPIMNTTYKEKGLGKLLSLATVRARAAACCGPASGKSRAPNSTDRAHRGCSRAGYSDEYKTGAGSCP